MRRNIPSPARWSDDKLTEFLDSAREHQFATFANKIPETAKIVGIDECFWRVLDEWTSPHDWIAALLMIKAHSAYRAAAGCAFAGQSAETHALLRFMLENAGYAIRINRTPELAEVWLKRQESDADRAKVQSQFKFSRIRKTLASLDVRLEKFYFELYERAIAFGAHPNEMSVTSNLTIGEKDNQKEMSLPYLIGDGIALDHSLRSLAQVGVCVLLIFQVIFQERFELLGVSSELIELQKEL